MISDTEAVISSRLYEDALKRQHRLEILAAEKLQKENEE
jgi:hypothetical protein